MIVIIIEISTGRVIATVPVVLQGMNYTPSEQEYFSAAWKCAVEDSTVEENSRNKYNFKLVRSA
jgi:hypothetical protein